MSAKKTPRPARQPKSAEARAREAGMIRTQLEDLGFPAQDLEEIREALDAFVRDGASWTGTYKRRHLGVEVLLQLSMQAHVTSFARVRRL